MKRDLAVSKWFFDGQNLLSIPIVHLLHIFEVKMRGEDYTRIFTLLPMEGVERIETFAFEPGRFEYESSLRILISVASNREESRYEGEWIKQTGYRTSLRKRFKSSYPAIFEELLHYWQYCSMGRDAFVEAATQRKESLSDFVLGEYFGRPIEIEAKSFARSAWIEYNEGKFLF